MTNLREAAQMALDALEHHTEMTRPLVSTNETIKALRAALANEFNPDWDQIEALQESLREHMAEIQRLRARLAQPEPEELGEIVPADEEQLKRIAKLVEPEPVAWIPVSEAMPKSNVIVLACYKNSLGNVRRIRAQWTAAKTEEASSDWDFGEYDEAEDCYWTPEGWYECIDNWDEYSSIAVHEGEITHWMPLPNDPYAAPPQREWVGLTDEDYEAMAEKYVTNCYFDTLKYARAIEAKLKEKNT